MSSNNLHHERIRKQAIQWVVDLSSQEVGEEEMVRFHEWINEDERHRKMYQFAERTWRNLAHMDATPEMDGIKWQQDEKATKISRRKWRLRIQGLFSGVPGKLVVSTAMLMVAILSVWPWLISEKEQEIRPYVNAGIPIIEETLDDGSHAVIGANSAFDAHFDSEKREIVLTRGDAFFAVAKEPMRPFIVRLGNAEVTVLGTSFDLHKGPKESRITVEEGRVSVGAIGDNTKVVVLKAGQRVIVDHTGELGAVEDVAISQIGTWRQGRFDYEETELAEIIADVERYCDMKFVVLPENIRNRRLTTSFRVGQCEQLLESIQVAMSLEVIRTRQGLMLLPVK